MTLDSRPQSTRNDPFSFRDTLKTEADQEEEFGTSLVEEIFGKSTVTNPPRMTTDLASGLKKLGTKISRNSSINTLLSEERLLLDEESEGE